MGDEVSINVRQRRLCLDCKLLLADALIILQPKIAVERKVEGEHGEMGLGERRGKEGETKSLEPGLRGKRVSEYCNNL